MAKIFIAAIHVNFVLIPSWDEATQIDLIVVIKNFAVNLYHHSHFLTTPFEFATFFTLAISNKIALFVQLVCF